MNRQHPRTPWSYGLNRLGQSLLTLWLISVLTFIIAKAIPGGPFGLDDPDQAARVPIEMRMRYRELYGLDQPIALQYLRWLGRVLQGDFGVSYTYRNETVQQVLARTLPVSIPIGLAAGVLALTTGIPLGIAAATRRGAWPDRAARMLAVTGAAIPIYVLATLCVVLFAARLHWLPLTGWGTPGRIILPVCILALAPMGGIIRFTRAETLEVLTADYVRTARAKGLSTRHVLSHHVLRNALLPALTLAGPLFAYLLAGSFFVETIFNIPGTGAAFVYAAADRDYPLIMAGALLAGSLVILLNLAVDVTYGLLDPRLRIMATR